MTVGKNQTMCVAVISIRSWTSVGEAADNLVEHHYPPIGPNIPSKLPMLYSRALLASK